MILTLLSVGMLVVGVVMYASNECVTHDLYAYSIVLMILGTTASFICMIAISCTHFRANQDIYKAQMEYETLLRQLEVSKNSTNTLTYVTATENIIQWNVWVADEKYYQNNVFTSWFYSKKYVDSLEYIEVEE